MNLVGIVGEDFPKEDIDLFKQRNVDLAGSRCPREDLPLIGYMRDLNVCQTHSIALNV